MPQDTPPEAPAPAPMPAAGDPAPDFTLPDGTGASVTLSALRPGRVVLYFYPKDDTPGCTVQATDFTARAQDFADRGAVVLGVSRDSVASHARFAAKHGLGVTLLADEDGEVCRAYGVWGEKKNYGRSYMGITRSTFLIGPDGTIARVWRNVRAKGHADELLQVLDESA